MGLLKRKVVSFVMVSSSVGLMGVRMAQAEEAVSPPPPEAKGATSSPSLADTESTPPVPYRVDSDYHAHRGFYVGLKVGGGYRSFTGSDYKDGPVDRWSAKGGGVGLNLSIGGAIVENLFCTVI